MVAMHKKLYKDSPEMKRDDEDGKMKVKKQTPAEKSSSETNAGTDGIQAHEGLPPHVRHVHERRDMHGRHEMEHAVEDAGKNSDKKKMHERHLEEIKAMYKRHEKEDGGEAGMAKAKEIQADKGD